MGLPGDSISLWPLRTTVTVAFVAKYDERITLISCSPDLHSLSEPNDLGSTFVNLQSVKEFVALPKAVNLGQLLFDSSSKHDQSKKLFTWHVAVACWVVMTSGDAAGMPLSIYE